MKKILCSVLILAMTFTSTLTFAESNSGESDSAQSQIYTQPNRDWITVSDWAWDYVEKYFDTKLMPSSIYHLTDYTVDITREQFCELIVPVLVDKEYVNNLIFAEQFSDCDNAEVLTLAKLGIINGTSETTFEPQKKLTREEAATILYRISTFTNICKDDLKTYDLYNDDSNIFDWAKTAVYKMNDCDIMSGVGENNFSPKSSYSIEQAIKTMLKIYNSMPSNEGIYPNAQNKEEKLQPNIDFVIATWYNGYYAIQYNDTVYISKTNLKKDSVIEIKADDCFGMNI